MSDKIKAPKGLEGVIADVTRISKVMPETNSLTYRGYAVQELTAHCTFEEIAYLLPFGELPTADQYQEFLSSERQYRTLNEEMKNIITLLPRDGHPMDALRTCVSVLGMQDRRIWDSSPDTNRDKYIKLLAAVPSIIAHYYRHSTRQEFIEPRQDISMAENFFHMCFGEIPDADIVKAFDASLILYAEHSFNASTFTTRVVTSTQSDFYSAIVAGIGALKGPLHGGANEYVMHMMEEIGSPEKAHAWMLDKIAKKEKVMGFGHRVYRNGDSRVPTMHHYAQIVARKIGESKWMEMYDILRDTMFQEKGIHPNLDFPAGPAYYMMGFPIPIFTPLFVMARVSGWAAHIMEQAADNRIIRPLSEYIGVTQREVVPMEKR